MELRCPDAPWHWVNKEQRLHFNLEEQKYERVSLLTMIFTIKTGGK